MAGDKRSEYYQGWDAKARALEKQEEEEKEPEKPAEGLPSAYT